MTRVVKILLHPDGERRVLILESANGTFGYQEEALTFVYAVEELREKWPEKIWTPCRQNSLCICETPKQAEQEARGRVEWLRAAPDLTAQDSGGS